MDALLSLLLLSGLQSLHLSRGFFRYFQIFFSNNLSVLPCFRLICSNVKRGMHWVWDGWTSECTFAMRTAIPCNQTFQVFLPSELRPVERHTWWSRVFEIEAESSTNYTTVIAFTPTIPEGKQILKLAPNYTIICRPSAFAPFLTA